MYSSFKCVYVACASLNRMKWFSVTLIWLQYLSTRQKKFNECKNWPNKHSATMSMLYFQNSNFWNWFIFIRDIIFGFQSRLEWSDNSECRRKRSRFSIDFVCFLSQWNRFAINLKFANLQFGIMSKRLFERSAINRACIV